jgi:oligopeptidase B
MFEEMKGRIKEDDARPRPRRSVRILHALRDRRAAPDLRPQTGLQSGNGWRREEILLDEEAEAKGKAFYQVSAAEPQPRPQALRLRRRRAGVGGLPDLRQGPGDRRGPGEPVESSHRRLLLVAGQPVAVLDPPRRQRPPGQDLPPPGAGRPRTTCWSMTSPTTASSSASASPARSLHRHQRRQPGDQRDLADPAADPTAAPVVFQPREVGLRYESSTGTATSWSAPTPTARSTGSWSPAPDGHARPRELEGLDRPQARPPDHRNLAFKNWFVRLEGRRPEPASSSPTAPRSRNTDRHSTRRPTRWPGRRLRVRHPTLRFVYQSPTTPRQWFDYDMATGASDPAQDPGNPLRPRPGRLRHPPPTPRPRTAPTCRSPS